MVTVPSLLIIDMLAEDKGHLTNDDFFLASSLSRYFCQLRILSSPASTANLNKKLPAVEARTLPFHAKISKIFPYRIKTILRILSVKVQNCDEHILLQSFEEISALIFMLIHPKNPVFLKVTNNLGNVKNNWKRRLALKLTLARANGILVHCKYEKRITQQLCNIDPQKIHVVKFHQFGRKDFPHMEIKRQNKISYIGGGRSGMGLDKFLQLAKYSPFVGYTYSLNSRVPNELTQIATPTLEINNRYLSETEYFRKFYESQYVIMPYSIEYEGKTSGIFCDAVLTKTPVIVPDIEPFSSFFSFYGPLGHLINFDSITWLDDMRILNLTKDYAVYQKNMEKVHQDHNLDSIGREISRIIYNRDIKK